MGSSYFLWILFHFGFICLREVRSLCLLYSTLEQDDVFEIIYMLSNMRYNNPLILFVLLLFDITVEVISRIVSFVLRS
jgi:hypothetical protein